MPKFLVLPQEAGYNASPGSAFHYADLGGGRGRRRRKFLGQTSIVSLTFEFDSTEYDYWNAFYRTAIGQGTLPFTLPLILDNSSVTDYEVAMMPDTLAFQPNGDGYIVQFDVEVKPLPIDAAADQAILDGFEAGAENIGALLARLSKFINVDAPNAIGV